MPDRVAGQGHAADADGRGLGGKPDRHEPREKGDGCQAPSPTMPAIQSVLFRHRRAFPRWRLGCRALACLPGIERSPQAWGSLRVSRRVRRGLDLDLLDAAERAPEEVDLAVTLHRGRVGRPPAERDASRPHVVPPDTVVGNALVERRRAAGLGPDGGFEASLHAANIAGFAKVRTAENPVAAACQAQQPGQDHQRHDTCCGYAAPSLFRGIAICSVEWGAYQPGCA